MEIELRDYANGRKIVDIGDLNDVAMIKIDIVNGDEVCAVMHNNHKIDRYDSTDTRIYDHWMYTYAIYTSNGRINLLNDPEWLNRKPEEYLRFAKYSRDRWM